MYEKPKVTIKDAYIDGEYRTGEFVFPRDIRYEFKTESEDLFQASGTAAVIAQAVLSLYENGDFDLAEGLRQQLSKDIGGGLHIVELDWTGISGHDNRWGDTGTGGTPGDATGEDIHAQMAVFDRYLQRAIIDSTKPARLRITEYSEQGRYAPLRVVPRNPNSVFDSTESSSIYDGTIAFVETQSLDTKSDQEER